MLQRAILGPTTSCLAFTTHNQQWLDHELMYSYPVICQQPLPFDVHTWNVMFWNFNLATDPREAAPFILSPVPDATTPRSVFSDHSDETNDRSLSSNVMILSRIRRLQNDDFSNASGISGKVPGFFWSTDRKPTSSPPNPWGEASCSACNNEGFWLVGFGTFFIFHVIYLGKLFHISGIIWVNYFIYLGLSG